MIYFPDTNTLIYFFNRKFPNIRAKLESIPKSNIKISSVVAAELFYGAYKSTKREYNLSRYKSFLGQFETVPFDSKAADIYGNIRVELELRGEKIGWNDLLIAATVKANNGILVSNNLREFSRIKGLDAENWTE